MKTKIHPVILVVLALAGAFLAAILMSGCASLEQSAYRTVGTTTATVDAAMKAWGNYVVQTRLTADDPGLADLRKQETEVRAMYAHYQAGMSAAREAIRIYKAAPSGEQRNQVDVALEAVDAAMQSLTSYIYSLVNANSKLE